MNKEIDVKIKLPSNWFTADEEDVAHILHVSREIRETLKDLLMEQAIKKIMAEIEIPKVEIDKKELKAKVLELMAERAVDNMKNN